MHSYIISTGRLGLRNWRDSDVLPFAEMNRDPEVMKYFPNTLSTDETRAMVKRIQAHFERNGFGLFVVENKTLIQKDNALCRHVLYEIRS
jgi:RimJ/RimL family protein N-acetyltransferase